jgi:hypothetical protein
MTTPPARVVPGGGSPMLWSLGRPQLLWPDELLRRLPERCRRSVLVHELAHLRRRDHWVGRLELVAACVWWWNPLFWYVRRELHRNAELACDAWVVGTLPGERRAYAEALIEVIQCVSRPAAPAMAVGMGVRRLDIERRLTMIMREEVPFRVPVRGLLGVGLLAFLVLPAWTLAQQETKTPAQQTDRPPEVNLTFTQASPVPKGTAADTSSERDRRLQDLEKKLQDLLKEVQGLRSAAGGAPAPKPAGQPAPEVHRQPSYSVNRPQTYYSVTVADTGSVQEVTLSRASYKLPREKAEALAAFLREHIKTPVLETKVDGDSFTVTTTPEVQKAIGQFVALMQDGRHLHLRFRNPEQAK